MPRGMSPYAFAPLPFPVAPSPLDALQQPQGSDEEILLRNFLETGETNFAPQVQRPGEWTPEQWQIAAMSGDPMGVREIYNKTAQEGSEQDFIKQLGTIDWTAPDAADRAIKMATQNPSGMTTRAMSIMEMLEKTAAAKKTKPVDVDDITKLGTEPFNEYLKIFKETKSPELARAGAYEKARLRDEKDSSSSGSKVTFSEKEKEKLDELMSSALSKTIPSDEEKVAAYNLKNKTTLTGKGDMSKEQWDQAHNLAVESRTEPLLNWVRTKAAAGLPLTPELKALIAPVAAPIPTANAIPAPVAPGAPVAAPFIPAVVPPVVAPVAAPPVTAVVPPVQAAPKFSFQTYEEKNPSPYQELKRDISSVAAPVAAAASNIVKNIAKAPGDVLSDVILEDDVASKLIQPPADDAAHTKSWQAAKTKVGSLIEKQNPAEMKEKLAALLLDQSVPPDYFFPPGEKSKAPKGEDGKAATRVPALTALHAALKVVGVSEPGAAFKGRDGNVTWAQVAQQFAYDQLEKLGEPVAQIMGRSPASNPAATSDIPVSKWKRDENGRLVKA
jgi:hypothetical protein